MRLMGTNDARALQIFLDAGEPLTPLEIGIADGRCTTGREWSIREIGHYLIRGLVKAKIVRRVGREPVRYDITERGRIALALFRAKENRRCRTLDPST